MLLPYTVDVPMERVPFTNWVLIGITFLVSIGVWIARLDAETRMRPDLDPRVLEMIDEDDEDIDEGDFDQHNLDQDDFELYLRQRLTYPLSLQPRQFNVLQLVSHLFVHGDIFHLAGNLIFLFVFGNAVNAKLGHLPFLGFYFLFGVAGGLAWMIVGDGRPLIGASGAIMGIIGMFFVLFPRNEVTVLYFFSMAIAGSFEVASGILIGFYMVADLFGCLMEGGGGAVAYISHLAGALVGIIATCTLLLTRWIRSTRYEQNLLQIMDLLPEQKRKSKKRKKARVREDDEEDD